MAWSCRATAASPLLALNRVCSSSVSSSSFSCPLVLPLPISTSNAGFRQCAPMRKPRRERATDVLSNSSSIAAAPASIRRISSTQICRAAGEYQFPDPIPEFAQAETDKFREHLLKKLVKKDIYGDEIQEVVGICTEIFSTFLHNEYGGPGTLLVIPFIDMADTLNEQGLPGGPQAARAAVKWAQAHVDKDWKEWTGVNKGS